MNISVCMIVWNEEDLLEKAVASTVGLADEVVVVDTGSDDGTVALARELGCKVITGADRMHKGQSRNRSLDEATGDWCVALDADEMVQEPKALRAFLEDTDAQAAYMVEHVINGTGAITLSHSRLRCWRHGTYRYKYRAHEIPLPVNGAGKVVRTNFAMEHRPPSDRRVWKPQYFLDRLTLDVKENPGEGRPLFYLGRQYCYGGEWQKAVDTLEQYLVSPGYDQADALHFLARAHGGLEHKARRTDALYRACSIKPERRDWWGELGEMYHADGKMRMAIGVLKCALEIPPDRTTYVSAHWYGAHIYDLLARCLWNIGRVDEGAGYARKALELDPANERLQKNVYHFDSNRLKQVFDCIPELREPMDVLYVGANQLREPECVEMLHQAGHCLTLLEIWPANAEYYKLDPRFGCVIEGDVQTADLPECDAAFWWHGPEHVVDFEPIVKRLERAAKRLVVLASPWGHYEQGSMYGNENETHVSGIYPADFHRLGYAAATQGEPDQVGSHILAWKRQ